MTQFSKHNWRSKLRNGVQKTEERVGWNQVNKSYWLGYYFFLAFKIFQIGMGRALHLVCTESWVLLFGLGQVQILKSTLGSHVGPGCVLARTRHAPPKGSDCPVLTSYQMWFCQKLLKNAKNNSKIVQIWLISICRRTGSCGATRCGHGFHCYIWHFWAIFGRTTSGSSPKQDILDLWQKHVWPRTVPNLKTRDRIKYPSLI